MTPRQRAIDAVAPHGRIGVEIGPLNRPLIRREDGAVLYADHCTHEDLRRKYAQHPLVVGAEANPIVEVDLVLENHSLAEALGTRGPVDYVVASHVMEHVADPIGWLNDLAASLREGGVVFLAVPDKRFTFDFYRTPSTTGDLVAHHLAKAKVASPAQVFEHAARTAVVDVAAVWEGRERTPPPMFGGQLAGALHHARGVAESGYYIDAHCTVYTPVSFLSVFRELIALDLIPFEVVRIDPTAPYALEFFVTLRKDSQRSPEARAAATPRLGRAHHDPPEAPEAPVRSLVRRLHLAWQVLRTGRIPARSAESSKGATSPDADRG